MDIINYRKVFLVQMDTYIKYFITDEDFIETWLTLGLPDCYTQEDIDFIAEDDDLWKIACETFGRIMKNAN